MMVSTPVTGYVATKACTYDGRNGPGIDLGLATSPIGPAHELQDFLRLRNLISELCAYPDDPHHTAIRTVVLEGLALQRITPESILFGNNGSYGAGDEVIRYFRHIGYRTLFAPAYSFPNVSQWAVRHGVAYSPLPMGKRDPCESLAHVFSMSQKVLSGSLLYIDFPNNPFGSADPELFRRVVDHVVASNGIPLVDVAFGEVLGDKFGQTIQYILDKGGVCIGSLSKTQGLPGLRTGYAILPRDLVENGYSGEQRLVFGLHREAEFYYRKLFERTLATRPLAQIHAERVAIYNMEANTYLLEGLRRLGLEVGTTDLRTPIQVVISQDANFHQKLSRQGLVTESLRDYGITVRDGQGYRDAAVRMMTPRPGQMEEVLHRVELALYSDA